MQRSARARGSAVVFMILLMGILVAGMVTSMAMLSGIQTQSSGVSLKRNAAFYAAEAGLQQAVWNMNSDPTTWMSSLPYSTSLPNGCIYTVSVVGTPSWPTDPVTFKSVGQSADGSIVTQATVTVTNAVLAPGIAIGGNMQDSGTLTVNGSVQVVGPVTRSGTMTLTNVTGQPPASLQGMSTFSSSGNFTIPGNLAMNGAITASGKEVVTGNAQSGGAITHTGNWNIGGSTSQYSSPNNNFTAPTVDTASLISQAQANGTMMFGGTMNAPTFDFTASPNGIIYINGNTVIAGSIKIKGSGTLVIKGNLLFSGTLGTVPNPVAMNLVTTGDMTNAGNINMTGALAVGGNYNKSGSTNITGVVVVQSNILASGAVNLTYGTPPWFIHYTGSGGSNIQVSNFSGATY